MSLQNRISDVIELCEIENNKINAYPYLPEIIETLRVMSESLTRRNGDTESKVRLVRGLGRLVTEDFTFSESDLGSKILNILDDFDASIEHRNYR